MNDRIDPPTASAASTGRTHSIGAVLEQLQDDFPDISVSKIRFLESRGLVSPNRAPSGYRKFAQRDIDRLRWILTQQRDHFLPLRVIKERLDRGELDGDSVDPPGEPGQPGPDGSHVDQVAPGTAGSAGSRFAPTGADDEALSADELTRVAELSVAQLDELVRFGLLEPRETDEGPRYDRDELRIARAAGAFLRRGIEARHLKAWRVAAEREAGMLEQIVVPLSRQGASGAGDRAREVADDLIDMGNAIREAIIVKTLRQSLGPDRG